MTFPADHGAHPQFRTEWWYLTGWLQDRSGAPVGFQVTFLIQHWLGVMGMPRRYGDYLPGDGFQAFNIVSTVGSGILGVSMLFFLWNVIKTSRTGKKVTVDDPWGWGMSLEWATSCPPPRHNFTSLPRIRSERPAFDLHYPELAAPGAHATAVTSGGSK